MNENQNTSQTAPQTLSYTERSFLLENEHKVELEKNFKPSCLEEYEQVKQNMSLSVLRMIKSGKQFSIEDDNIKISVSNKDYLIPYVEFKNFIGYDNYDKYIRAHEEKEKKEKLQRLRQEEERIEKEKKRLAEQEARLLRERGFEVSLPGKPVPAAPTSNEFSELKSMITNLISASNKHSEEAESESKQKIRSMQMVIDDLNKEIAELKSAPAKVDDKKIDILNKEIDRLRDELGKNRSELSKSKEDLAKSKEDLAKSKEELAKNKEEFNKNKTELEKSKSELTKSKEELAKSRDELTKSKNELEKSKGAPADDSKIKELNDKIKNLEAEKTFIIDSKKSLEEDLANANGKIKELNKTLNDINSKQDSYQEMSNEIKRLNQFAYNDPKTGVFNINAFNEDFPSIAKGKIILGVFDVLGVEYINDNYGPENGDIMIAKAVEEVQNAFPNDKIYRMYGAGFAIIIQNNTLNNVNSAFSMIVDALSQHDINIIYGTAVGNECADHYELAVKARESKSSMKLYVLNNGYPSNDIRQSINPVQASADATNAPKYQEVPINNVNADMFSYATGNN